MPITVHNPREEGLIEYPDGVSDEEIINHLDSLVNDPYGPSNPPDEDTFRAVAEWLPGFGEYYSVKDLQDWYGNYKKLSQKEAVDPATFAQALPALAGIFIGAGEARSVKEGIQKLFDVATGKTALRGSNAKARKLLKAQDLESEFLQAGKTKKEANEEIFAQTGWWRDIDGEWKFEISDRNSKLKKPIGLPGAEWDTAGRVKLEDVFDHPELFDEYPTLRDMEVEFIHEPKPEKLETLRKSLGYHAQYDPKGNTIFVSGADDAEIKNLLLHELQHAVQQTEGFARGGDSTTMQWLRNVLNKDAENVTKAILETPDINSATADELVRMLEADSKTLERMKDIAPNEIYWRLKGEAEARNVQIRDQLRAWLEGGAQGDRYTWNKGFRSRQFTKEQAEKILNSLPTASEDVPDGSLIVIQPKKLNTVSSVSKVKIEKYVPSTKIELNPELKKWFKEQPHSTYMSWAGFKHRLMDYYGIPQDKFDSWDVPPEIIETYKKEANRRFK